MSDATPEPTRGLNSLFPLPRWKKILLGLAAVALVFGGVMEGMARFSGKEEQHNVTTKGTGGSTLTPEANAVEPNGFGPGLRLPGLGPDEPAGASPAESEGGSSPLAPLLLWGGLSFFVGFCCGSAVRAFVKIGAIIVGVVCLVLFGLSYAGVLTVDWAGIEGWFNQVTVGLKDQFASFKDFAAGSLPSAGMGTFGFFTGLRKK